MHLINSFHILWIFIITAFIIFFSKNKIKIYLFSILLLFPIIDLSIPPGVLGIKLFDALTLFILPFYVNKKYSRLSSVRPKLRLMIIGSVILFCIGSYLSYDQFNSFVKLIQFLLIFVFLKILHSFILIESNREKIKVRILYLVITSLIFLFIQLIIGVEFTFYSYLNSNVTAYETRFPGYFHDPQKFAQFLIIGAFLLYGLYSFKKSERVGLIVSVLSIVAITATGARAAFLGLLVGILWIMLKHVFITKSFKSIFFVAIFCSFGYYLLEDTLVFKRAETGRNDFEFRYSIWVKAYGFFTKNPVTGIGIGSYQPYVAIHDKEQVWKVNGEEIYFDHPESGYLLWLVEFGIINFLILIISLLYLLKPFKIVKDKIRLAKKIIVLEAGLLGWLISFMTVYSLGDRRIMVMLVILIALLIVLKFNSYRMLNNAISE